MYPTTYPRRARPHALLACASVVACAVAACSSSPSNAPPAACDLDPALDAAECATLKAMALPGALPPSVGNAKADDHAAAYLGFVVFFDARFSADQNVRCETCHDPVSAFDDAKPTSVGLSAVVRNSPSALNVARMTVFFWDGRADSLWSQPLFAFENPLEMGFTRLELAHQIAAAFPKEYANAFGALPALDDAARFPPKGKPGDAAWDAMAAADQDTINRIAANVGKAIEAYERRLASGPAPFDAFLGGKHDALSARQRRGMVAFAKLGCADCHGGPMLSDETFHNLGVAALPGVAPDRGRIDGVPILVANPFNLAGPYADGAPRAPVATSSAADLGAFRTPTLRNVALSAPYAHNGSFPGLADVIAFHLSGGGRSGDPSRFVGDVDAKLVARDATPETIADLADFLAALNGTYPPSPWNTWPSKN